MRGEPSPTGERTDAAAVIRSPEHEWAAVGRVPGSVLEPTLHVALLGPSRFGIGEPFAGGLEAHTVTTARALMRLGHRVTVFAGPAGAAAPADLQVVPVVDGFGDFSGCARLDTEMPPDVVVATARGYARVLQDVDRSAEFDVIHNNSLHAAPVDLDGLLQTPIVHFLHCPPFAELSHAHRRRAARLRDPHDGVVAVSSSLAQQWCDVAASAISNGVDTHVWRPSLRTDARVERCVWAGRIVSEKAPHLAIDAARRAGRPIVLAGPVQEPGYFERMVLPRLGPDARYAGHLGNAALASLFASSTVGVVTPCWDEPFGLVVAEMLACGTPVAAFARGALPDIVVPEAGVLARPGDVDDLADAIGCAARLSPRACRRYAVERLSMDRMAQEYVEAYRRTIDNEADEALRPLAV